MQETPQALPGLLRLPCWLLPLVGQQSCQLPVHVPALLLRLVQPIPQVGNGIRCLAALTLPVY